MSLVEDLNNAVERVVQEFKGKPIGFDTKVEDKLKEENTQLTAKIMDLETAIQSAVDSLTTVTQPANSNMAEPVVEPVTAVAAPEEHVPS